MNHDRVDRWLTSRGIAVCSVDYRVSSGFGKAFLNAGDQEHSGKMHDDLVNAGAIIQASPHQSGET